MSEIRILHISLTKSLGGIAAYQKSLVSNIDSDVFKLSFVTPYPDAMLIPFLNENGIKVYTIPSEKRVFSYFRELCRIMKNGNFDAVHIHKNSAVNPLPFLAAKLSGIKTVIAHSHNTSATVGRAVGILHYVFRPIVRRISTVHLACSSVASDWMFGKNHPAKIVKNGIDVLKFSYDPDVRNAVRLELGIKDELLIGHVGNYIYQKNHKFMVEIMKKVIEIRPDAKLMFVGRGESLEEVKRYAEKIGVGENILFLGSRTDVNRLYQAMDVFLMPSFWEGLPIACVEAQAAGLPLLLSDVITDEIVLTDKVYMVPLKNDASDWAEKLLEISNDGSRNNNESLLKESGYDASKSVKAVEDIYMLSKR